MKLLSLLSVFLISALATAEVSSEIAPELREKIGRIEITFPSWTKTCTAVVFQPRKLFTSGHCFDPIEGEAYLSIHFYQLSGERTEVILERRGAARGITDDWAYLLAPKDLATGYLPIAKDITPSRDPQFPYNQVLLLGYREDLEDGKTLFQKSACQIKEAANKAWGLETNCVGGPYTSGAPLIREHREYSGKVRYELIGLYWGHAKDQAWFVPVTLLPID